MEIDELTEKVIGCTYAVHNELGAGFQEKVYENALRIELEEIGMEVQQNFPFLHIIVTTSLETITQTYSLKMG